MELKLSGEQVWQAIEKELFAVIGMVTSSNEARTAGVVYVVGGRKLYVATGRDTWKARHLSANNRVSVTIPIAKRVLFMPWLKIPPATITFQGRARLLEPADTDPDILRAILRDKIDDERLTAGMCVIEIEPVGEFLTYGVGIPLMDMREPVKARGRAPVA